MTVRGATEQTSSRYIGTVLHEIKLIIITILKTTAVSRLTSNSRAVFSEKKKKKSWRFLICTRRLTLL
jgi:hypothetical protein